MSKINNMEKALKVFEEFSIKQSKATEQGDSKLGNKAYTKIVSAIKFLKEENAIHELENYLNSSHIGSRLWSASYILSYNEEKGVRVLEELANGNNIHSLTAKITLEEWRKGNLKF